MNVLICTSLPFVPAALAHKMIPQGINVISVSSSDEIKKAMPVIGRICLIDDLHLEKMELIRLTSDIKKFFPECRFVLLSSNADISVMRLFIKMGFDAVLPSSWQPELLATKFLEFIQKYCKEVDQRKYIRVKTDPQEPTKIKLSETSSPLEGHITDISMGGVAASFQEIGKIPVRENQVISKAQILLDGKSIFADMKLVKKTTQLAAFTFEKLSEQEKDSLAEYIYYKTFLNYKKNL